MNTATANDKGLAGAAGRRALGFFSAALDLLIMLALIANLFLTLANLVAGLFGADFIDVDSFGPWVLAGLAFLLLRRWLDDDRPAVKRAEFEAWRAAERARIVSVVADMQARRGDADGIA